MSLYSFVAFRSPIPMDVLGYAYAMPFAVDGS